MHAQRNTKQPLVKEQQILKPEACHPAENVSKPLIRVRPPTPPQLLKSLELDSRNTQKPSDPHGENELRRLSPVSDPAQTLAVPTRARVAKKEARPCSPTDDLPLFGMPTISQKGRTGVPRKANAKGAAASERGGSAKSAGTWKVQGKHLVSNVRAPSVSRSTESVPAVLHTSRGSPLV